MNISLLPTISQECSTQKAFVQADDSKSGRNVSLRCGGDAVPGGIGLISEQMGFLCGADIFRMMLLAFIAGFAERLVPDSIDRLIRREKEKRGA
jgi:hypothetical protein